MDKIQELAEKLTAYNLKYGHPSPDDVTPYVDILRAELKPLLDAARTMLEEGAFPAAVYEQLAAELQHWKEDKR